MVKNETDSDSLPMITDSPVDPYEGMSEREKARTIYMNRFNAVMLGIFDHITQFYTHSDVDNAKEQITSVLIDSPDGPICCFLKYVYMNDEYRRNLMEMNESFFLDDKRTMDPELAKDQAIIEKMFSFKQVWTSFADDTKRFIMRSLQGLVKLSTRYISYMD